MDSIVDTFFPLIGHIDDEVDEIDSLVIDPATKPRKAEKPRPGLVEADLKATLAQKDGIELSDRSSPPASNEKAWYQKTEKSRTWKPLARLSRKIKNFPGSHIAAWRLRYRLWRRETKLGAMLRMPAQAAHNVVLFLGLNQFSRKNPNRDAAFRPVFDRSLMLRRITELRRLTTGLTRLLGSKYQVVTRLKKRAAEENGEVGAYIGDVQGVSAVGRFNVKCDAELIDPPSDHILMLQTSLNHYEYILSHCQPAYMSYLGVTSSIVRGDISNMILALSCVTVGYLPMQFVTCAYGRSDLAGPVANADRSRALPAALFSINVHIPTNLGPEGPYGEARRDDGSRRPIKLFFVIMAIVSVIAVGMLLLIRYWRWQAKQKSRRRRTAQVDTKTAGPALWWSTRWQAVKFSCRGLIKSE